MPFQIISGDIQTSYGEARVEPFPDRTGASEAQIHPLRGLDQAREYDEIGTVCISEYSLTRAGQGDCRYVIKTPVPDDAASLSDPDIIRHCYRSALQIVRDFGLKSVAFPLIGVTGNDSSKELALHIAAEEIRSFLNENDDTDILLVIRDKLNFMPDVRVRSGLSEYIHGIEERERRKREREWNAVHMASTESFPAITEEEPDEDWSIQLPRPSGFSEALDSPEASGFPGTLGSPETVDAERGKTTAVFHPQKPGRKEAGPAAPQAGRRKIIFPFSHFSRSEREIALDESFSQMLFRKIDEKGFRKDSDFYKKANITKQTFSKMKAPDYHPKKTTAVAAAIALELSLDGTNELLMKAGYCLSHSLYFDMIVEYFILKRIYDVDTINISLFDYDQPLLGG